MRKIKRNILKKQTGNNKISNMWRKLQIKKYGLIEYFAIRSRKDMFNKEWNY